MRIVTYLLATLLLLPYLLLAAGFLLIGQAVSGGTLWSFFDALLAAAVWLIPWGLLALALVFLALLALGIGDRLRWLGGVCLCVLASCSGAVILIMATATIEPGHLLFLLPCFLIAVFGAWLALAERRAAIVDPILTHRP